jgi:hypothetical protein
MSPAIRHNQGGETLGNLDDPAIQAKVQAIAAAGGGSVATVTGNLVDNTDPANPVVNAAHGSDADWIPVTYNSPWVDAGGGVAPSGFRKEASGRVTVRFAANGVSPSVAFTLPVGYRPLAVEQRVGMETRASDEVPLTVFINPNGDVQLAWEGASTGASVFEASFWNGQ